MGLTLLLFEIQQEQRILQVFKCSLEEKRSVLFLVDEHGICGNYREIFSKLNTTVPTLMTFVLKFVFKQAN